MKKIFEAADFYFFIPILMLYLIFSSDGGNVEIGITTMLISVFALIGLILFYEDFSTKTEIKNHSKLCNLLLVFEDILYIVFFIGLFNSLGISFIPRIGR